MASTFNRVMFYVMAFLAVTVSLYALSYYFGRQGFLASKGNLATTTYWRLAFYAHVGGGGVALATGWVQFMEKFRQRNINRHRVIGKIYALAILCFASTSGMVLAFNANEGLAAKMGFACLSFAWFYTTIQAWLKIVNGNILQHRIWITRSYALTLAAVTLRIWLPLALIGGLPAHDAYIAISWFCWVPNLVVTDWLIVPRLAKGLAFKSKPAVV